MPRVAATLLLVRDAPFEVLMVERAARGQFASALVFPGGVVEEADASADWLPHLDGADGLDTRDRALRIAAIRETFEETGVIAAADGGGCPPAGISPGFLDLVRGAGIRLRLDALAPFAHWVTPEDVPKRFDTHFFVVAAPRDVTAVCDGVETVSVRWAAPRVLLAEGKALLFPTRLNLGRLAESGDSASALAAAALRPAYTVCPRLEVRPGGIARVIPLEAGYAETEEFEARPVGDAPRI